MRLALVSPLADRRELAAIFAGGAAGTLSRATLADTFPRAGTARPQVELKSLGQLTS